MSSGLYPAKDQKHEKLEQAQGKQKQRKTRGEKMEQDEKLSQEPGPLLPLPLPKRKRKHKQENVDIQLFLLVVAFAALLALVLTAVSRLHDVPVSLLDKVHIFDCKQSGQCEVYLNLLHQGITEYCRPTQSKLSSNPNVQREMAVALGLQAQVIALYESFRHEPEKDDALFDNFSLRLKELEGRNQGTYASFENLCPLQASAMRLYCNFWERKLALASNCLKANSTQDVSSQDVSF